jgi:hypothetical protein
MSKSLLKYLRQPYGFGVLPLGFKGEMPKPARLTDISRSGGAEGVVITTYKEQKDEVNLLLLYNALWPAFAFCLGSFNGRLPKREC